MSSGGEFRVGSDAPEAPGGGSSCGAPWAGEWEDRTQARPECQRERGHDGSHRVDVTGPDGRGRRYEWGRGQEPGVEAL